MFCHKLMKLLWLIIMLKTPNKLLTQTLKFKIMNKLRLNLIFLLLSGSLVLFSQENKTFPKVEEMHAKKWQYILDNAQLSQKESDATYPVFMEYEKAIWTFHAKNLEFFKSIKKKQSEVNLNYSEINDRYAEIEMNQAQLFKNYHLKLKRILAPECLFRYYKAEREFKRTLLQNLQNKPRRNKQSDTNDQN